MEDEKFSQGDSDVSEAEDDDSNEDQTQNAPIMSLFASFYGIEDPNKGTEGAGGRGTIDDANFDVDSYVKVGCRTAYFYFFHPSNLFSF